MLVKITTVVPKTHQNQNTGETENGCRKSCLKKEIETECTDGVIEIIATMTEFLKMEYYCFMSPFFNFYLLFHESRQTLSFLAWLNDLLMQMTPLKLKVLMRKYVLFSFSRQWKFWDVFS